MKPRHAAALALVGWYLMVPSAKAQQPTPLAPADPNWCLGVPAAPPPPGYEHRPELWTQASKECSRPYPGDEGSCADVCIDARRRWELKKEGRWGHLQPETNPSPVPASSFPGWYLMIPPSLPPSDCNEIAGRNCPLSDWKMGGSYDTAKECWDGLNQAIEQSRQAKDKEVGISAVESECIASEDRRLKPK